MAALANVTVTEELFNEFVGQLFIAMEDKVAVKGGVAVGTKGENAFGIFKISPTTGNWSFLGTEGKFKYALTQSEPFGGEPPLPDGLSIWNGQAIVTTSNWAGQIFINYNPTDTEVSPVYNLLHPVAQVPALPAGSEFEFVEIQEGYNVVTAPGGESFTVYIPDLSEN